MIVAVTTFLQKSDQGLTPQGVKCFRTHRTKAKFLIQSHPAPDSPASPYCFRLHIYIFFKKNHSNTVHFILKQISSEAIMVPGTR